MIWFLYELAADTESDEDWEPEPDDESPDSDAELSAASATSCRGGVRDRKGQKSHNKAGAAIRSAFNSYLSNLSSCK